MAFQTGSLVGEKYRVTACIGSGGMGLVYAATNEWTGREVVIKTMQAGSSLERFMREVRATASVKHPNIIDVLDLVKAESSVYLILERLYGQSMQEHLVERERLPPAAVIDLVLPILGALEFAHGKGLIHRDIKPSNIFLAQVNEVIMPKLLDFGIASMRNAPALTVAGQFFGTPGYAAPEQIMGKSPSPVTDIWAVGVLLFECLSGKLPFGDPVVNGKLAPLSPEGPELELLKHTPQALVQIIASCLSQRESDRPQSAALLAEALCNLSPSASVASAFDDTVQAPTPAAARPRPPISASPAVRVGETAAGAARSGLSLSWLEQERQRSFSLPLAELCLAAGQNGSLILGAPAGAPVIAKMRPIGPTFSIVPLGSSEFRRNGKALTREVILQPGDTLDFGSLSLTVEQERL